MFEKKGSRVQVGEKSVYAKQIMADPELYFTDEVMAILENKVQEKFSYGTGSEMASQDIDSQEPA